MSEPKNDVSVRSLAGRSVEQDLASLAQSAVDLQLNADPEMRGRFTGDRYRKCVQDTALPLTALSQALLVEEPALFDGYVTWAKSVLADRGLPDGYLVGSLMAIRETLAARLDGRLFDAAAEYIDLSLGALNGATADPARTTTREGAPLADVALSYLEALLAGDRGAAAGIVHEAAIAGAVLPDIYEHVFRAAQHEVGRMWQSNRLSVAMEHYATGATEAIMSQLPVIRSNGAAGPRRFLGACVDGEQHDLAIRMVCDVLGSEGWDTFFLGASTPESALVQAVEEFRPTIVGLSTTWLFRADDVRHTIAQVHQRYPDVKVVVGGAPFDRITGLAGKVGADACGGNLLGLPARFTRLISPDEHSLATPAGA